MSADEENREFEVVSSMSAQNTRQRARNTTALLSFSCQKLVTLRKSTLATLIYQHAQWNVNKFSYMTQQPDGNSLFSSLDHGLWVYLDNQGWDGQDKWENPDCKDDLDGLSDGAKGFGLHGMNDCIAPRITSKIIFCTRLKLIYHFVRFLIIRLEGTRVGFFC